MNSEKKLCMVCGSKDSLLYATKKGHDVWKCNGCAFLFVHPLPTVRQLSDTYAEGYFTGDPNNDGYMDYDYEKDVTRKTFSYYLDVLEDHVPVGEMFEVGAATGYFISMAKNRSWNVAGVDYADYAAGVARSRGLNVKTGDVSVLDENKNKFDAVVMCDVFEHLTTPKSDVDVIYNALRPGGVMMLATPNSESLFARVFGSWWHAIVPPQHVHLFSKKTAEWFLEEHGFKVEYSSSSGKWFTVQYMLRVLYTWLGFSFLYKAAQRLAGTKLGRFSFPLNLGDTMVLVARKI